MIVLFLMLAGLFIFVQPVIAGEPPIQISPGNNSSVSSSTLNWQAPAYPVCSSNNAYRIQVDDDPSFPSSSIYRNVYTKNTYYTPQLTDNTWYWRVMARDETCDNWSAWSNVWSFTLVATSPSPISTSTQPPTSSPASTPTSSATESTSSFTISNIPSQINSNQSFAVSINLSLPDNSNTNFYLKGAFKKPDSSNYFGLTKVGTDWIKNSSAYTSQFKITTDSSGNWSGNLEVKPDSEDSGFTGTGDYIFKVGKYNASDTSPSVSWSNEATIKIISTETESDQGKTLTNTSVSSTNPTTLQSSPKTKTTTSSKSKSYDRLVYHTASVAAATVSASSSATPSAETEVKNQKQISPIVWIGLIFIFAGVSSIGYIYLKRHVKIPL